MFIKKSWNTKSKNKTICYQIAQSYRPKNSKYPKTKILANITHLPLPLIEKISLLLKSPTSAVISDLKSFFKRSFIFGPILFLYLFMQKIKIIECLKVIPVKSRILLIGIILNRTLEPRSKLGSVSWLKKTAFSLLWGIEEKKLVVSQVYKAQDYLHQRMGEVLDNFFKNNKKQTVLLLYDVTSVFFEGKGPQELAREGFSRDNKPENPQILLCLCLNEEKLPIYFDILAGNIQDKKTVIPLIKKLREKFSLTQSTFVGDRGMVSIENLEFIEKEGIDYIVALTHREARELIFKEKIQLEIFDKKVPITIYSEGKKRYILCGSEYRKEREEKILNHLLKKGREALESVARMVKAGRLKEPTKVIRRAQKKLTEAGCEKFYDFTYEGGEFKIIEKSFYIQKAKALCGYYILETTNTTMSEEEIDAHYKELKFVEDAFRQLKELVEIRPIFHWKERRVRTHIFLCILAQTVVNKVKERLKESGWLDEEKGNSFSHFLDILYEINVGIFEIEGARTHIITQLNLEQKELLNLFKVDQRLFTHFAEAQKACRLT